MMQSPKIGGTLGQTITDAMPLGIGTMPARAKTASGRGLASNGTTTINRRGPGRGRGRGRAGAFNIQHIANPQNQTKTARRSNALLFSTTLNVYYLFGIFGS
jgi:hypothetical protein